MAAAMDTALDSRLEGPERILALGETALREVCIPVDGVSGARLRLPLYLGMPEHRPGFGPAEAEAIRSGFAGMRGLPIDLTEVRGSAEGHAAGILALAKAVDSIQRGLLEACIIGGVDSYFHPDTMEWLDEDRRLVGAEARSAFIPGEGAGFIIVMGAQACDRLKLRPLAQIEAVAVGTEAKPLNSSNICLGEGLTATIHQAVQHLHPPTETISSVICDINGERYRSEEWAFATLRLPQYLDDPASYRSPADHWGDVGAASGPLFTMLACEPAASGYLTGPRILLWASSEHGRRGAVVLRIDQQRIG